MLEGTPSWVLLFEDLSDLSGSAARVGSGRWNGRLAWICSFSIFLISISALTRCASGSFLHGDGGGGVVPLDDTSLLANSSFLLFCSAREMGDNPFHKGSIVLLAGDDGLTKPTRS